MRRSKIGRDQREGLGKPEVRIKTGKPGKGDSILNVPRKAKVATGRQND